MERIFQLLLADAVKISVPGLLAIVLALMLLHKSGPPRPKNDGKSNGKPSGRGGRKRS
jgi:hypothetical protein